MMLTAHKNGVYYTFYITMAVTFEFYFSRVAMVTYCLNFNIYSASKTML